MENVFAQGQAESNYPNATVPSAPPAAREPSHAERLMDLQRRIVELEENMRQAAVLIKGLAEKIG